VRSEKNQETGNKEKVQRQKAKVIVKGFINRSPAMPRGVTNSSYPTHCPGGKEKGCPAGKDKG